MSCDTPAVVADHISKTYWLYPNNYKRCLGCFIPPARLGGVIAFQALADLSFEIFPGNALALIGKNGAGKSTALQILTGVLAPTSGTLRTRGRVCALLELGSGFNAEFSGRENVYLNGALLGLSKREIDRKYDEIINFADIGMFIEQPVRTYSSGMYVRLAFAVQACLEPDVLIVDEALAVGDIFFQQKCHAHIEKLMNNGTAVILVTHDMASVLKYCTTAILLEEGKVRYQGDVQVATRIYYDCMAAALCKSAPGPLTTADFKKDLPANASILPGELRYPGEHSFLTSPPPQPVGPDVAAVKLIRIASFDEVQKPRESFEQGEYANIFWEFEILKMLDVVTSSITLTMSNNIPLYSKNMIQAGCGCPSKVSPGTKIVCFQKIRCDIAVGEYTIAVGFGEYSSRIQRETKAFADTCSLSTKASKPLCTIMHVGVISIIPSKKKELPPFYALVDLCVEADMAISQ